MSSPRFQYTVSGMMYGVKINRKNSLDVLKTRTKQVQARMTRLAAETIERRINDGSYYEKLIKGGKGVMGTKQFEETPMALGSFEHHPHKDVPNPLSLIVLYGLKVTVRSFARKGVFAEAKVVQARFGFIKFFNTKNTPRVSTIWQRLDQTCLPFVSNGNYEKLVAQWSRSTQRAVQRAFLKEFKGDLRKAPKVSD